MIFRDKLTNGIRVVGETMEGYRSVSIGVWIGAGSVCEREGEHGASHFIEHMLFKGTEKRSAGDIAEEIDALGGNLNAFTSKECTCFYVKVLNENTEKAMELLSDIICRSKLDGEDIEREKGVIIEEILMNDDSPEDLAHETLCQEFYKGDPLALPVLGTEESVSAFTRETLMNYKTRMYRPDNIVISAAGDFDFEELMVLCEKYFSIESTLPERKTKYGRQCGGRHAVFVEKDIEQTHICIAFNGFPGYTDGQYPLYMLNNAVGGSISSRLFQSIREQKGMAYSVYSTPAFYDTTGYFTLYAGTNEKQAVDVTRLMLEEYKRIRDEGITEAENERSKNQMKTGYVLGRESTSAHSSSLGRAELFDRPFLSEDEIIRRIDAVTLENIGNILPTVCDFENMTAVFVGRVGEYKEELRKMIEEA